MRHSAEIDYEQLHSWLLAPHTDPEFCDATNLRLRDVWRSCESNTSQPRELAIWLRQQARRWDLMGSGGALNTRQIASRLTPDAIDAAGLVVVPHGETDLISARPWDPDWLNNPAQLPVDGSFA